MVSLKRSLFLILLVLIPGLLSARDTISKTSHHADLRIPYRTGDGKVYDCGNSILREMAKDVLREPWLVTVRVSFELGLDVVKEGDRNQLVISLRRPGISGDTMYRHFPVASELFPSHISLKLRWANRADTSGYTEEALSFKHISLEDSLVDTLPVASFDPQVDTLLVRDVALFYDSLALQNFLSRIELIHDYYASLSLLDSLQRFTADLQLDNHKLLPVNFLKVEELNSVIERIDARDFPGRLLRNDYDPLYLVKKYQETYKHSKSLVYNFMDEMHKTAAIPWNGNADLLADYFTSRIFSYVRRSYLMDQQQGRIYGDCLNHFFDHIAFPQEDSIPAMMLAKMFPDARQDTITRYVSTRIYASYQRLAAKLMDQSQYAEAFSVIENGHLFATKNPSMAGFVTDDLLQSKAAQGICDSYLGIASSCIASHKFHMAETYLHKADQYAVTHAGYIRSDSSYRRVFSELFFLRNADCDQLLEQKKYGEALECYQQFEKTYSSHDLALVNTRLNEKKSMAMIGLGNLSTMLTEDALKRKEADTALFYYEKATALRHEASIQEPKDIRLDSLAPVMARIKFGQIFKEGAGALEKRQFTLAVARLNEAKLLSGQYKFDCGREFDSIYRQAMKNLLIVQLSASQKKIWANQFDSAQMALQKTEESGFDYGLLTDPDFISAIEKFKVKILEQQCRNLQDSVDLRMIRAGRGIALRNFVNATVYLNQALDFARSMPACRIAEEPIRDSISKYSHAAGFQQKMTDIQSLVATGNYAEAIRELVDNQQDFLNYHLGRFGLEMEGIYDYIRERNNPYLSEKAAMYYLSGENYGEALRFLQLVHDQGFQEYTMKGIQNQLGQKIARDDYRKSPQDDALENLAKYNAVKGWFDSFRDSYLDEWHRLVKVAGKAGN